MNSLKKEPEYPSLAYFLLNLEDYRHQRGIRHPFLISLSVILWGFCSGCENLKEIEFKAQIKEGNSKVFKDYFDLPHGLPSVDTLRRTAASLDFQNLNEALAGWAVSTIKSGAVHLAVDGKCVKSARKAAKGQKHPPGIVSAVVCGTGIVVSAFPIEKKKSEITVVPEMIRRLSSMFPGLVEGSIFTTDAPVAQAETFSAVKEAKAFFCCPVKGNQKRLSKRIDIFLDHRISIYKRNKTLGLPDDSGLEFEFSEQKNEHGRDERRILLAYRLGEKEMIPIPGFEGVKTIGRMIRLRRENKVGGKVSITVTNYQCTKSIDAGLFLELIMEHWDVETEHYELDVNFGEDGSVANSGNITINLGILRRMGSNLLALAPEFEPYGSIGQKQAMAYEKPEIILEAIMKPLG